MAAVLWQLIWVNLVSLEPFTMTLRVSITAGAVDVIPWPVVLLVAATASSIGVLPVYFLTRWKIAHPWERQVAAHTTIARLRTRWRGHMFLWQIVLNAIPFVDLVGTGLAGCERYPFWRLFPALVIGRSIHNLPVVLGGLMLAKQPWFQTWLSIVRLPVVTGLICLIVLLVFLVVIGAIRRAATQAID